MGAPTTEYNIQRVYTCTLIIFPGPDPNLSIPTSEILMDIGIPVYPILKKIIVTQDLPVDQPSFTKIIVAS